MDLPGVVRDDVNVKLENNVLEVEGYLNGKAYEGLTPVYTEYKLGHFSRTFTISNDIQTDQIGASMADGVLTLTLPKKPEAATRHITIN